MDEFKSSNIKEKSSSVGEYLRGGLLFFIVFGFICAFAIANFFIPAKSFSENENKALAQMPSLTF